MARPMVFAYSRPARPSFWMDDTPAALSGVWVGASGRVIGYWHGQPETQTLHLASGADLGRAGVPVGGPRPGARARRW